MLRAYDTHLPNEKEKPSLIEAEQLAKSHIADSKAELLGLKVCAFYLPTLLL